jgi:hypothetical protein
MRLGEARLHLRIVLWFLRYSTALLFMIDARR